MEFNKWENPILKSNEVESREKRPELEIKFLFSPHATANDFKSLKSELDKADVFVPEVFGWSDGTLQDLRDFSESEPSTEIPNLGVAIGEMIKTILGSNKAIELIDVPKGHPLVQSFTEVQKNGNKALNLTNFDEMISELKDFFVKFLEIQKLREEYILSQIRGLSEKIAKDYPTLGEKDKLNVLITLGSYHTNVYRQTKNDFKAEREFNVMPHIYDNLGEVLRKLQQLNRPEANDVTDIEAARTWLYLVLFEKISSPTKNSLHFTEYLRLAAGQFSLEEIRDLFKKESSKMLHAKEELEKKNFPIPTNRVMSDEEFVEFLKTCREFSKRHSNQN